MKKTVFWDIAPCSLGRSLPTPMALSLARIQPPSMNEIVYILLKFLKILVKNILHQNVQYLNTYPQLSQLHVCKNIWSVHCPTLRAENGKNSQRKKLCFFTINSRLFLLDFLNYVVISVYFQHNSMMFKSPQPSLNSVSDL
jgi:hypothetical protein